MLRRLLSCLLTAAIVIPLSAAGPVCAASKDSIEIDLSTIPPEASGDGYFVSEGGDLVTITGGGSFVLTISLGSV